MLAFNACSTTDVNHAPPRNLGLRLSVICLITALAFTLLSFLIAIFIGDTRQMVPPMDLGLASFGYCVMIAVIFWVVGVVGMIGVFISRKIKR